MANDRPDRRRGRRDRPPEPGPEPVSRAPDRPGPARNDEIAELIADLRAAAEGAEASRERDPGERPGTPAPPRQDPRPPLDVACEQLIAVVRKRCPGLIPAAPIGAGTTVEPLPILAKEASALIAVAARQAVLTAAGGRAPADPSQLPATVLWQDGPAALLVEVGAIAVELGEGLVSVAIPVRCDQLPRGREVIMVDLVLGTPTRPTGLLAAASEPRGSRLIVERWGEALTALAWQALLDAAGGVAGAAGVDDDGAVLVPSALTASPAGLAVVAQARHTIDRVRPGRVVLPPRQGGATP